MGHVNFEVVILILDENEIEINQHKFKLRFRFIHKSKNRMCLSFGQRVGIFIKFQFC